MASIKKYTKKDGSTAYMFNAYLGVDPVTGKSRRTTRRGFRTQKEAKLALSRLELEVDSKGFVKQNYSTQAIQSVCLGFTSCQSLATLKLIN